MVIIETGNIITLKESDIKVLETIPVGNYLVKVDPRSGEYFLEKQDSFTLPEKIYGDVDAQVDRYLNTFKKNRGNLGVLLKGLKGTGKSLAMKRLCMKSELPVIMITQDYSGTAFESFLTSIKQECIILIDEFEKVYSGDNKLRNSQDTLLSILDGIFEGKKLFLLTANNQYSINTALLNRPGRIHYLMEYRGLADNVISDIIDDLLNNKKHKADLLYVLRIIGDVNMDSLVSLISEMNMYKEDARTAINQLNIRPEACTFKVTWDDLVSDRYGRDDLEVVKTFSKILREHPLVSESIYLENIINTGRGSSYESYKEINFSEADITFKGDDIIVTHDDTVFTFTKEKEKVFAF